MIGSVDRTLDVAHQGVYPTQLLRFAAAIAASGNLRLVRAASRLHAPETSQPGRAHQCSRLQMLLDSRLLRTLAEARRRAQPELLRTSVRVWEREFQGVHVNATVRKIRTLLQRWRSAVQRDGNGADTRCSMPEPS